MIQQYNNESLNVKNYLIWMLKKSALKDFKILDIKTELDKNEETKREHFIICRFCNNFIALPESHFEIDGKHTHIFINSAGNTFRIGCFMSAIGCVNYGDLTIEHTWFSGFTWRYAICSSCFTHLGWQYISNEKSFYGLILSHLIENI